MTSYKELIESIDLYVEHGVPTGSFLEAMLSNQLVETFNHADIESLTSIPKLIVYMYNEIPGPCWGSKAKVNEWIAQHLLKGTMK